ncbi:hypothetical protein [Streptomyces olivochromogenes]|uniref:hypothetical protein n=1 Tax=Streptomyces olivochromogenes TaxID=1963 RepID=UPI001F19D259|nr:hypothetical protein [Streptomyces olivochromogenes]MCF3135716.1 hypothetical protein [Streptomyces olivochromogenes]
MAEVEELLDGVAVRLPAASDVRARGDRRLARRRGVAVATAALALAGGLTWAVLPEHGQEETRPSRPPTASRTSEVGHTPYKKDGVVLLLKENELPLYANWHWRAVDEPSQDTLLSHIGDAASCGGVDEAIENLSGAWRYERYYRGDRKALARHGYTEYDSSAEVTAAVNGLRAALAGCGLKKDGEATDIRGKASDTYSGTNEDHRQTRFVVAHGDRWVSVIVELGGKPLRH